MNLKRLNLLLILTFTFVIFPFFLEGFAESGVVIERVTTAPTPFSPNGDGVEDKTSISAVIRVSGFKTRKSLKLSWYITIKDSEGKLIKRLRQGNIPIQNNSEVRVSKVWDGRDRRGKIVANGPYSYKISARVRRKKAQPVQGEITVEGVSPPAKPVVEIKNVSDSPDPFSPNGDGIEDSTEIKARIAISGFDKHFKKRKRLPLIWSLGIKDSRGKLVRFFIGKRRVKNNSEIEVSRVWDGKRFGRRVVPDGVYTYTFRARLVRTRAKPKSGEVTVKTQSGLSVSVSPDYWHIGETNPSTIVTMSNLEKITVTNDGGVTETYSLQLINPDGWQVSQSAVGPDTYILNAGFSSDINNIFWDEADHALSEEAVRCTATKFAGDQSGENVAAGEERTLWLQFKAPSSTSVTAEQEVKVIITAQTP